MISYKNTPGWDEKAHELTNDRGVDRVVEIGVVMAGVVNFVGPRSVRDSFARWGYPAGFHRVTGGLEVTAGLLLLIPATGRAGAIGVPQSFWPR
jgi:hypothetical protein